MLNKIIKLLEEADKPLIPGTFGLVPAKLSYQVGTPVKYGQIDYTVHRVYDYKEAQKKYPDLKRMTTGMEPEQVIVISNTEKIHGIVVGKQKTSQKWTFHVFNIPLLL